MTVTGFWQLRVHRIDSFNGKDSPCSACCLQSAGHWLYERASGGKLDLSICVIPIRLSGGDCVAPQLAQIRTLIQAAHHLADGSPVIVAVGSLFRGKCHKQSQSLHEVDRS